MNTPETVYVVVSMYVDEKTQKEVCNVLDVFESLEDAKKYAASLCEELPEHNWMVSAFKRNFYKTGTSPHDDDQLPR